MRTQSRNDMTRQTPEDDAESVAPLTDRLGELDESL
jgi:hypothetical protein